MFLQFLRSSFYQNSCSFSINLLLYIEYRCLKFNSNKQYIPINSLFLFAKKKSKESLQKERLPSLMSPFIFMHPRPKKNQKKNDKLKEKYSLWGGDVRRNVGVASVHNTSGVITAANGDYDRSWRNRAKERRVAGWWSIPLVSSLRVIMGEAVRGTKKTLERGNRDGE